MRDRGAPLVSIVIPLHNAAETIARTVASVAAQSWPNLEIVVVDDGSSDTGPLIVADLSASDRRIRLCSQQNLGVAAARNRGAEVANGQYLAFLDADDLWARDKVALQMAAIEDGGEAVGLVYTWSALINAQDRIYSLEHKPDSEGWVFPELCRSNFVGNGSSPLIRREAFNAVQGYDPSLRAQGAQGCEDLMIYMRIAELYEFRVVRRHLTGYRVTHGNMSSNVLGMLRSCELTLGAFQERYPQYEALFQAHRRDMIYWLLVRAMTTGPISNAVTLLRLDWPEGVLHLGRRIGDIGLLMAKARTPLFIKAAAQRALRQGGPFRPVYLEAAL